MNKISYLLILILVGCTTASRYPGWEFVRIENSLPSDGCSYKVQEACSVQAATEGCFNWFKKRATLYDANTVVLTGDLLVEYEADTVVLTKELLAEYYTCPTAE